MTANRRRRLRSACLAVAFLALLGGGLFGWHRHLGGAESRLPALDLSHGECRGVLDDDAVRRALTGTHRAWVNSEYSPTDAFSDSTPIASRFSCSVSTASHTSLNVTISGERKAERRDDDVRPFAHGRAFAVAGGGWADTRVAVLSFDCVTPPGGPGGDTHFYYSARAVVPKPGPSTRPELLAELTVAVTRRAVQNGTLGCTSTTELPGGPVTLK
ncbi:hypothetical protein [Kitasatospora sp. NPDC050543]|uniref:hypothetical protein n=1 Tax=Kitasatospora sp. NPDC050543 TaxID=3364054 RepID=UPI0037B640FC